jgi:1-deoxy-D-xylulose-5-phosphate reductoisomerase
VTGLAARYPGLQIGDLAERYPQASVAVAGGSAEERDAMSARIGAGRVSFGADAVAALAASPNTIVINGIVGLAGLGSTLAALEAGNRVGLANKESMVAAGELVQEAAAAGGGELIPVDSEHSAVFQCLLGEPRPAASRLILTASGGPFRGMDRSELEAVTPEQALAHPTWDMGRRISVDSATLMNKGLEVIEAHHLFGFGFDEIEVVVHPQSIVHSMVEYRDGSLKAHLGRTDMRIPIQYAISHPQRPAGLAPPFDLTASPLEFFPPDPKSFRALDLAYAAGRAGGSAPAILNAADEVAVEAFLQGRLGFLGITEVVEGALDRTPAGPVGSLEEVLDVDRRARETAAGLIAGAC